jgi:hypothetical protein
LSGDDFLLGVEAAKGVKGATFLIGIAMFGIGISLVLELPMGPRMARSIFFWANPNFRSANVLVFLTGVLMGEGFLSFSKGILTIRDFFGVLGDLLADLFFFFLPKGNLTMSFDLLGDFFFNRIRSGDTRGGVWSGVWCTGDPGGVGRGTRIRSGGTLFFFWVSHLNK